MKENIRETWLLETARVARERVLRGEACISPPLALIVVCGLCLRSVRFLLLCLP